MKVFLAIALIGCGLLTVSKPIASILFVAVGVIFLLVPTKKKKKTAKTKVSSADLRNVTVPKTAQPERLASEEAITVRQYNSLQRSFIAIDVETTGLDPKNDRIIEIALLHYADLQSEEDFSSLVNAEVTIPERITEINHITQYMVDHAPSEKEVFLKVRDFIMDINEKTPSMLVAHNAKFDISFLRATFNRLGIDAGHLRSFDTIPLAKEVFPGLPNYKLSTVLKAADLDDDVCHRAVGDASDAADLLIEMLEKCHITYENE